jgi:uncharacterized protein
VDFFRIAQQHGGGATTDGSQTQQTYFDRTQGRALVLKIKTRILLQSSKCCDSRIIEPSSFSRQQHVKFSEDNTDGGYYIQKYEHDHIIINDRRFISSLIICPDAVIEHWPPRSVTALQPEHFKALLELSPEVVLLGVGDRLVFPSVAVYANLIEHGIGVEVMDTGAACRTYNILMGEGRRVVAGLIL